MKYLLIFCLTIAFNNIYAGCNLLDMCRKKASTWKEKASTLKEKAYEELQNPEAMAQDWVVPGIYLGCFTYCAGLCCKSYFDHDPSNNYYSNADLGDIMGHQFKENNYNKFHEAGQACGECSPYAAACCCVVPLATCVASTCYFKCWKKYECNTKLNALFTALCGENEPDHEE